MTTSQTGEQSLTFTQFQILKAIPKGQIVMRTTEPGTWRHLTDTYAVTSTVRTLKDLGLIDTDRPYVKGFRRPRITQAGYAAMSAAHHNRPTKKKH